MAHKLAYYHAIQGHQVVLYCRRQEWEECFSSLQPSIPYLLKPLPRLPLKGAMNHPRLAMRIARSFASRQARRHCFDVWHATMLWPAGLFASMATKSLRVLTCHGADIQIDRELAYGQRLDPRFDTFARNLTTRFDVTTAVSQSVRRDLLGLGFQARQIELIPNGVDVAQFQSINRSDARRQLMVGEDEFIILSVGRNHPKKGFQFIPEIASTLRDKGIKFRWFVVGRGTQQLESDLARRRLQTSVHLVDEISPDSLGGDLQVPARILIAYYRAADVFCLPALLESFGIVLVEAFASAIPVVTTDAPGCSEIVENNRTGIVCSAKDPVSVADAIARLANHPSVRLKMGDEALNEARARYDWPMIARAFSEVYETRRSHVG